MAAKNHMTSSAGLRRPIPRRATPDAPPPALPVAVCGKCDRLVPRRDLALSRSGGTATRPACHFGGGTVWCVRVQASPEAVQLIQEQGGKLYVRAKRSRCCHGSLTFLETSNEPAERSYRRVSADEIELYFDERLGDPEELVIEARGRRRKHVGAYWDGCAYVV